MPIARSRLAALDLGFVTGEQRVANLVADAESLTRDGAVAIDSHANPAVWIRNQLCIFAE